MPVINLSPTLVGFLDPLKMTKYYRHQDLWETAMATSKAWVDFGIDSGLSIDEIVAPFGISTLKLDQYDATASIAAIWINAYLESSLAGGGNIHESH